MVWAKRARVRQTDTCELRRYTAKGSPYAVVCQRPSDFSHSGNGGRGKWPGLDGHYRPRCRVMIRQFQESLSLPLAENDVGDSIEWTLPREQL